MIDAYEQTTFGDLFEITSSKRVLQKDWKDSGIPFYRAREIVRLARDGYVNNELFISENQYKDFENIYGVPKAGDLMVSAVGTLGACYVVRDGDRFYYKDASVLNFSPKREICSQFFKHIFATSSILDQINAVGGSTVGTYTIERAKKTKINLPPLAQQQCIALILDKAAEIKAKREQALSKLDELAQSAFKEVAMGASGFTKLKDIATFQSGGTPSKENNDYWGGDIAWISSADIVDDQIVYGRNSITELGLSSSATSLATKGTILVVTRTGVGKVAIATKDTCYSQDIVSINLKPDYETNFIAAAIRANKSNFLRQARGATIQGITKEVLGAALIPNLQIGEQRKFAELLDAINFQRVQLIKSTACFDRLTNSLQHQAFTTGFDA